MCVGVFDLMFFSKCILDQFPVNCKAECSQRIPYQQLQDSILQYRDLFHDELDLVILAKISCGFHGSHMTQSTHRADTSERQRNRLDFWFEGQKICRTMFLHLHSISKVI